MTSMHPDLAALLAAVQDDPFAELPRFVLADWLQEHEEETLADRVRFCVQTQRVLESAKPHLTAVLGVWKVVCSSLKRHPQADSLMRVMAVWLWRRRQSDGDATGKATIAWLHAHGLASPSALAIARAGRDLVHSCGDTLIRLMLEDDPCVALSSVAYVCESESIEAARYQAGALSALREFAFPNESINQDCPI